MATDRYRMLALEASALPDNQLLQILGGYNLYEADQAIKTRQLMYLVGPVAPRGPSTMAELEARLIAFRRGTLDQKADILDDYWVPAVGATPYADIVSPTALPAFPTLSANTPYSIWIEGTCTGVYMHPGAFGMKINTGVPALVCCFAIANNGGPTDKDYFGVYGAGITTQTKACQILNSTQDPTFGYVTYDGTTFRFRGGNRSVPAWGATEGSLVDDFTTWPFTAGHAWLMEDAMTTPFGGDGGGTWSKAKVWTNYVLNGWDKVALAGF